MAKEIIKNFFDGQKILSANHLNQLVREARQTIVGSPPISVTYQGDNVYIKQDPTFADWWVGKIDAGGLDDYSDARYFVRRQELTNNSGDETETLGFIDSTFPVAATQETVQNIRELGGASHTLSDGQVVVVHKMKDGSSPFTERLVMAEVARPEKVEFWAKITESVADATGNRWIYSWNEVKKNLPGYGGWGVSGRSGASDAYNSIENINSDVGMLGIGITSDELDSEDWLFDIVSAPNNVIVRMNEVAFISDTEIITEYWFSYENSVDGSCV